MVRTTTSGAGGASHQTPEQTRSVSSCAAELALAASGITQESRANIVSMQIVRRERGEYVLRAGGNEIGQLREGLVWFHGFADEATARESGAAACGVLLEWYQERSRMGRHTPVTSLRMSGTVPANAQLLLGDAVVGRISRRRDPMGVELFDVEIALPGSLLHAVATYLIDRLYAAVAACRVAGASAGPDAGAVETSN